MKGPIAWAEELEKITMFERGDLLNAIYCMRVNKLSDDNILDFINKANSVLYIPSQELSRVCNALFSKPQPLTTNQLRKLAGKKPYTITN